MEIVPQLFESWIITNQIDNRLMTNIYFGEPTAMTLFMYYLNEHCNINRKCYIFDQRGFHYHCLESFTTT